jgi:hypothetical protein
MHPPPLPLLDVVDVVSPVDVVPVLDVDPHEHTPFWQEAP